MSFIARGALSLVMCSCLSALGCSKSGSDHKPTELHDQQGGEHLNFPAGGPDSPDYKKSAPKGATPGGGDTKKAETETKKS